MAEKETPHDIARRDLAREMQEWVADGHPSSIWWNDRRHEMYELAKDADLTPPEDGTLDPDTFFDFLAGLRARSRDGSLHALATRR